MNSKSQIISPVLAFLLPFTVRLVPEIMAWPYPIGFDTIYAYVPWIKSGYPLNQNLLAFFKGANLFPLLALLFDRCIINDPVVTVKLLGPLLYAFLGLSLYAFSRKVLGWSCRKSLLLVCVCSLYFISLRISWEMYRQMLGTIFLLAALTSYWCSKHKLELTLTPIFSLLTALSHEIAAMTLLIIFLVEVVAGYISRDKRLPALLSLILLFTFIGFMLFDPATKVLKLPFESFSEDRVLLMGHIFGFIAYSYGLMIPLTIYGFFKLKNRIVYCWLTSMILLSIWPIIHPQAALPLWFRWTIFMVYPLSMVFVEGFHEAFLRASKVIKSVLVMYLTFLMFLGVWYLVTTPEYAFPYFADYNPYKTYIQTSMVQSTMPIEDIEPTIMAIRWLSENCNGVVILHEAFYPWAMLYDNIQCKVILVRERDLSKLNRSTFASALIELSSKEKENRVYTIWWINGKGWYNVPSLPNSFDAIMCFERMCIYEFKR